MCPLSELQRRVQISRSALKNVADQVIGAFGARRARVEMLRASTDAVERRGTKFRAPSSSFPHPGPRRGSAVSSELSFTVHVRATVPLPTTSEVFARRGPAVLRAQGLTESRLEPGLTTPLGSSNSGAARIAASVLGARRLHVILLAPYRSRTLMPKVFRSGFLGNFGRARRASRNFLGHGPIWFCWVFCWLRPYRHCGYRVDHLAVCARCSAPFVRFI